MGPPSRPSKRRDALAFDCGGGLRRARARIDTVALERRFAADAQRGAWGRACRARLPPRSTRWIRAFRCRRRCGSCSRARHWQGTTLHERSRKPHGYRLLATASRSKRISRSRAAIRPPRSPPLAAGDVVGLQARIDQLAQRGRLDDALGLERDVIVRLRGDRTQADALATASFHLGRLEQAALTRFRRAPKNLFTNYVRLRPTGRPRAWRRSRWTISWRTEASR